MVPLKVLARQLGFCKLTWEVGEGNPLRCAHPWHTKGPKAGRGFDGPVLLKFSEMLGYRQNTHFTLSRTSPSLLVGAMVLRKIKASCISGFSWKFGVLGT